MLTVASYLAENARPVYERLVAYVGERTGESAGLLTGVPRKERLQVLDASHADVGFIRGWPYAERFDRPERPIEPLCVPVMACPPCQGSPARRAEAAGFLTCR